ncbi:MAG TPA: hypothetical protein VMW52_10455 [Phycisphaerae bacterium]|nr:hypothetical protein [Phycisphaerae bacterium]
MSNTNDVAGAAAEIGTSGEVAPPAVRTPRISRELAVELLAAIREHMDAERALELAGRELLRFLPSDGAPVHVVDALRRSFYRRNGMVCEVTCWPESRKWGAGHGADAARLYAAALAHEARAEKRLWRALTQLPEGAQAAVRAYGRVYQLDCDRFIWRPAAEHVPDLHAIAAGVEATEAAP